MDNKISGKGSTQGNWFQKMITTLSDSFSSFITKKPAKSEKRRDPIPSQQATTQKGANFNKPKSVQPDSVQQMLANFLDKDQAAILSFAYGELKQSKSQPNAQDILKAFKEAGFDELPKDKKELIKASLEAMLGSDDKKVSTQKPKSAPIRAPQASKPINKESIFPTPDSVIGGLERFYSEHEGAKDFIKSVKAPKFKACYNPPDDGNCGVSAIMYGLVLALQNDETHGAVKAKIVEHFPDSNSTVRQLLEADPEVFAEIMAAKESTYQDAISEFRKVVSGLLKANIKNDQFTGERNSRIQDVSFFEKKGKWISADSIDNVGRLFDLKLPVYELGVRKMGGNDFFDAKTPQAKVDGVVAPNDNTGVNGMAIILRDNHFMVLSGGQQDKIL